MNRPNTVIATLVIMTLTLAEFAFASDDQTDGIAIQLENAEPRRVLFVGNSYLYYNDSLHNHAKRITEELIPGLEGKLPYKSATIGGASLSHHAIDSLLTPGKLGIEEPFELVILQGGSFEVLTEERRRVFFKTAAQHAKKIRQSGAELAFYMTHAYVPPHRLADPNLIKTIAEAYVQVGHNNNALVIPVGLAFDLSYQRRPDLLLHEHFDGTHPNILGTYLAACVVHLSLYGGSLDDLEYTYFGEVPADIAAFLQSIATDTVAQFRHTLKQRSKN